MDKLITRKNLMIANSVLGALLALALFFGIVKPSIQAGPETGSIDVGQREEGLDTVVASRLDESEYNIITENDLFKSKLPIVTPKAKEKNYYDLSKVWELKGTMKAPDGTIHAYITDRGQPDIAAKLPHTTYDVVAGDTLEGTTPPRLYKVTILDVQTSCVEYYRDDMEDKTEQERTFKLTSW